MAFRRRVPYPSLRGHRLFALFVVAVLFLPLLVGLRATSSILPVQPLLLQKARVKPDATVRVIIQKDAAATGVAEAVARLNGSIIHDLHIINAVAAELPAHAVTLLAQVPGVRRVSLDAPVYDSSRRPATADSSLYTGEHTADCDECIDTTNLINDYIDQIGADRLWNQDPYLQGQDITVAILDSGMSNHTDLLEDAPEKLDNQKESRIIARQTFNSDSVDAVDRYGHGTHIGGIVGGNGTYSDGMYIGVAPKVNLISLKVTDDQGAGTTSDVVAGVQWIYENREKYNIRVVNVSLNSAVAEPYHENALNAALEILWFNGIVVVVSGGNNGNADNGILYPPANDPFFIGVGATTADGTIAGYSATGETESGFKKPDLFAPGDDIVSALASDKARIAVEHPDHLVAEPGYFRMSGTSMAAAVTTGAVALLLQAEPELTPDQVKYRLIETARPLDLLGLSGTGELDLYSAIHTETTDSANTGIEASQLLWSGEDPVNWDSVNWNSVNWNSVNWNSVNWNSVNWNSVNWNNVYWD